MRKDSYYILIALVLFSCAGDVLASGGNKPSNSLLSDDPCNAKWHLSSSAHEIVYIGGDGHPGRLALRRAALKDFQLIVNTDGQKVLIMSGFVTIEAPLRRGRNVLQMNTVGDSPALLINGKEQAESKGDWINLSLNNKDSQVLFEFPDAGYANLSYQGGLGTAGGIGQLDHVAMVRLAKKAVFEITVQSNDGGCEGTGWFMGHEGLVVTCCHVIEGATKITGAFGPDSTKAFMLEPWAIKPEWDLAILKVKGKLPAGFDADHVIGLDVAPVDPEGAEDVWAIGFPLGMDYTVTHGTVNAVRRFDQIQGAEGRVMPYSADSGWIQTDCTFDCGNSGGPIVNSHGQVVGIATWVSLVNLKAHQTTNEYYAADAQQITSLVQTVGNAPLPLAQVASLGFVTSGASPFIPIIPITQSGTMQQVLERSTFLRDGVCSNCGGTGLTSELSIETAHAASPTVPIGIETRSYGSVVCPVCNGDKYNVHTMKSCALTFVQSVSHVSPTQIGEIDTAKIAARNVLKFVNLNPLLFNKFVGDEFGKDIGKETLKRGSPFMALGQLVDDQRMRDQQRIKWVSIEGHIVLLTNTIINEAVVGHPAAFGGIFAGYLDTENGEVVPVLQNGFVISE